MSVKILPIYFTDKSKRHIVTTAFFLCPRLKTRVVRLLYWGCRINYVRYTKTLLKRVTYDDEFLNQAGTFVPFLGKVTASILWHLCGSSLTFRARIAER